jgi:hypothetical protein
MSSNQSALAHLRALRRLQDEFGPGAAARKLELLRALARVRLPQARHVLALHEVLCFLRAYPDDARVLAQVERMLASFDRRGDLRAHRDELADSGVAGTDIHYPFFPSTASWLARRFGNRLRVDWEALEREDLLERSLPLFALYCETPGLDEAELTLREWIDRLRGPRESDAAFLVRRCDALHMDVFARERFYEELELPLRLVGGRQTPSRTRARTDTGPIVWQDGPLRRRRPDLEREVRRPPLAIRPVGEARGRELIALAREAMITRSRDLDAFMHGDPRDVRLVDCGDNLQFACIGVVPERRLLLEAVYAFLTLKNGVPIGYVLASALLRSSEIAYNVFDTYRGAEAAHVYGRVLAMVRALFDVDTFTIYPYQLGHENEEGLKSGAWWFYRKLGFVPRDPGVVRLMRSELRRIERRPAHRSSIATLRRLAVANVYLELGRKRSDVIGVYPLGKVGLAITDYLAGRFGSDRERGSTVCTEEAAELLGARRRSSWTTSERSAFERWSPLVRLLPGLERWSPQDRRALVGVMRAKGGRRESDFVARFDRHAKLRAAMRRLAGLR